MYKWLGPAGHFVVIGGQARQLAAGEVVELPAGSSPELWAEVKGKKRAARKARRRKPDTEGTSQ